MPRGGPRPNAGRKSNAQLAQCHAQMDQAITPDDWQAIYARLLQIVKEADPDAAVKAARLLIQQRWSDGAAPRPEPEDPDDVCEIKFIHVAGTDPTAAEPRTEEDSADDEENANDDSQSEICDLQPEIADDQPAPAGPVPARTAEPPQLSAGEAERRKRQAHRLHMRHLASL